jgi:hypothetical protein
MPKIAPAAQLSSAATEVAAAAKAAKTNDLNCIFAGAKYERVT